LKISFPLFLDSRVREIADNGGKPGGPDDFHFWLGLSTGFPHWDVDGKGLKNRGKMDFIHNFTAPTTITGFILKLINSPVSKTETAFRVSNAVGTPLVVVTLRDN
jgi:hypothetical protein